MDLIDRAEWLKDYTQTFVVGHGVKSAETFQGVVKQAQKVDAVPLSVIDEIKAEIKEIIKLYEGSCDQDLGIKWGYEGALEIIDEYIKEHET